MYAFRLHLICQVFILALVFSAFPASAEERKAISIAVPRITSLLEQDHSGVYQRIMADALTQLDYRVDQAVFPYKRALLFFEQRKVDCIFSFTDVVKKRLGPDSIIASFPFGAFGYFMFTPASEPAVTSPEQLVGMRVAGVVGHDQYYRQAIGPHLPLIMVNSDEQTIALLRQGRIDALIAAIPDIVPHLDELNYAPTHPLFSGYDRLTCYDTRQNREFLEALSNVLRKLKADGTYRRHAGRFYIDFTENK